VSRDASARGRNPCLLLQAHGDDIVGLRRRPHGGPAGDVAGRAGRGLPEVPRSEWVGSTAPCSLMHRFLGSYALFRQPHSGRGDLQRRKVLVTVDDGLRNRLHSSVLLVEPNGR
jgi:hypothetical protein